MKNQTEKKNKVRMSSRVGSGLFGIILLLIGYWMVQILTVAPIKDYLDSDGWLRAKAELISLQLNEYEGEEDSYDLSGEFQYQVGGQIYRSNRIVLTDGSDSSFMYWNALNRRLQRASDQGVLIGWFNPDNPKDAVLERQFRSGWIWDSVWITLFFLIPGVLTLRSAILNKE